ncbi:MAG: CHAT domain-containing protein, partial [Gammaproteobacteria bacterium]
MRLLSDNRELASAVLAGEAIAALAAHCAAHYDQRDNPDLEDIGRRLFDFLDTHLQFRQHVLAERQAALYFQAEHQWQAIPWEILHDGSDFLVHRQGGAYWPVRLAKGQSIAPMVTQNRPLHLLFMATSPEGVTPVLDYEKEEKQMLDAAENPPLSLEVEDSGSLAGLQERLQAATQSHFDVVHLTGHADNRAHGPVFLLEDETGGCSPTAYKAFLDAFQAANNYPALLFLSGCRTAQAHQTAPLSLAQA